MLNVWTGWIEAARFAAEAQSVIGLRVWLLASGGPQSREESVRMVCEKVSAFADAEIAALRALADGRGPFVAAKRAYAPVRRRVHANSRRLLRALG